MGEPKRVKIQTEIIFSYGNEKYRVVYDYSPPNPEFPKGIGERSIAFLRLLGKLDTPYASVYVVEIFNGRNWIRRNPQTQAIFYSVINSRIENPITLGKKLSDDRKRIINFKTPILLDGHWRTKLMREATYKKMINQNKEVIYSTYIKPNKIKTTIGFARKYSILPANNMSIVVLRGEQVLMGNAVIGEIRDNPKNNFLVESHTFDYLISQGVTNIYKLNEKDKILNKDGEYVYGSLIWGQEEILKRKENSSE